MSWTLVGAMKFLGFEVDLWLAWMVSGGLFYGAMMARSRRRGKKA